MAIVKASRVAESSTFTGTATITLAGAYISPTETVTSHRTFSAVMADQDTTEIMVVADNGAWQRMKATYNSGANTLTRGTLLESSTGVNVTFAAGNKIVFLVDPTINFAVSDTAPTSPSSGDYWYDTLNGRLCIYITSLSGSQWVDTSNAGAAVDLDGGTSSTVLFDFFMDGGSSAP